jgi:hypothetical protein
MDQWRMKRRRRRKEVGGDACVARARRGYIGLT